MPTVASAPYRTDWFLDAGRRLGNAARSLQLKAPSFRAVAHRPANLPDGCTRSIRRVDTDAVVTIVYSGPDGRRGQAEVLDDMIAGVLAANGRSGDHTVEAALRQTANISTGV